MPIVNKGKEPKDVNRLVLFVLKIVAVFFSAKEELSQGIGSTVLKSSSIPKGCRLLQSN